ncbi:glutaredoxin-1-like [Strix uralensis]|uniref:glutaredoxin-1-like n=1 Tax=Strix uralensis TaxID=36305 RepID=UPI003DA758DC
MAEAFVKSKLRDDKVTLFVKDGCPYCRNAMEMLKQYNFRPECLQVCDITGMQSVQEYFRQTTGQNTVCVFIGRHCIGGFFELQNFRYRLPCMLQQIGALHSL